MKTIEEKAKAYDSIIEEANKMHSENCEACKVCIEELIPELAESEDEKIRKEIVNAIHDYAKRLEEKIPTEWLAWLEKQGEQKPFDYENVNIPQRNLAPKSAIEAIKEEKVDNANKVEPKGYDSIDPQFFKPSELYCQENCKGFQETGKCFADGECKAKKEAEQKPEENKGNLGGISANWSVEDEMFVHGLIRGLAAKRDIHGHTTFSSDCIDITETIIWLKSLKERIGGKV